MIDLKAAFDWVDRGVIKRRLEEEGISKRLRERIEEIYRETSNIVKVKGIMGERFWKRKGVRQECPLSPTLFSVVIADLRRELGRDEIEEIKVGEKKIKFLGYADDLVLLAENEEAIRRMLRGD